MAACLQIVASLNSGIYISAFSCSHVMLRVQTVQLLSRDVSSDGDSTALM